MISANVYPKVLKADSPDYNDPAAMRDYVERSRKALIRTANRFVVSQSCCRN